VHRGNKDEFSLSAGDLEKLKNRFHQLLLAPHNPITRTLNHRIHYGAFTIARPAEISPDPDDSLFG
jgi:hypothetical protein